MPNWFNNLLKTELVPWFTVHKKAIIVLFATFGTYLTYVFAKMFFITPGGVFIGHPNAWSDWALHISLVNIFAHKPPSEWFLYHPYYANGKLTYGFLVHLISGLLVKIGLPIQSAFFIVSFFLLLLFLLGLYALYFKLSSSKKESLLAVFIFFTSSGMGVFRNISTIQLQDLINPQQDFTKYLQYDWLAGNIPAAMLIPQRAFFIGITIGVWILFTLLVALELKKKYIHKQKYLFVFAGILAGILPIAHMHSFITIVLVTATVLLFALLRQKHKLKFIAQATYFVVPATVLSNILFFSFIFGGIEVSPFMTISLGWTAQGGFFQWVHMWILLWGAFLPIFLLAVLTIKPKKNLAAILAGFLVVFILANIVVFQPTAWDNTKLFAWVYLGFSILVSKFLHNLFQKKLVFKIVTIVLLSTLSITGALELKRLINFEKNTYQLLTIQEMHLAEEIRNNTATDAIFLTALVHNHPIPVWASRQMFLGYLGWVRNFGFEHAQREKITYAIYQGAPHAKQLLKENTISYIYVSSREASLKPNMEFLASFPVAFQNETITVFDTRSLWQQ